MTTYITNNAHSRLGNLLGGSISIVAISDFAHIKIVKNITCHISTRTRHLERVRSLKIMVLG